MKKRFLFFSFLILIVLFLAGCSSKSSLMGEKVTLLKSGGCGCCGVFGNYLEQKGFGVEINDVSDSASIKSQYKIPASMESCHTTIIGNYFVEGHMPLEAIEKLIIEKPDIKGIALPGMPYGSPGMPGTKEGEFVIYAVQNDGSTTEFMRI